MSLEPISGILKETKAPTFLKQYEEIKQVIINDVRLKDFFERHKEEINDEVINRNLTVLSEFLEQSVSCCGNGTDFCRNILQGFIPKLYLSNGNIRIKYERCLKKVQEDQEKETARMVTSMYIPKDVLEARLDSVEIDSDSRVEVVDFITSFVEMYKKEGKLPTKGVYLHGKFGVGKTFIFATLANEMAMLKVPSLIVYTAELFRELRSSLKDGTFEQRIKFIKEIPLLMLDDLGSEPITTWIRDEVLGSILHYRMTNKLPVFITSNYNYSELEEQLSYTESGQEDSLKAGRILERIKSTTIELCLKGENRRR